MRLNRLFGFVAANLRDEFGAALWLMFNDTIYRAICVEKFAQSLVNVSGDVIAHHFKASCRLFPSICPPQQACPDNNQNASIDGPLSLAGHETAGQNIDALQEPNDAGDNQ